MQNKKCTILKKVPGGIAPFSDFITIEQLKNNVLSTEETRKDVEEVIQEVLFPYFQRYNLLNKKITLFMTDLESLFVSLAPDTIAENSLFILLAPNVSTIGKQFNKLVGTFGYDNAGDHVFAMDTWCELIADVVQGDKEDCALAFIKKLARESVGVYGCYGNKVIEDSEFIDYFNKIVARECCFMQNSNAVSNNEDIEKVYPLNWNSLVFTQEEMPYTKCNDDRNVSKALKKRETQNNNEKNASIIKNSISENQQNATVEKKQFPASIIILIIATVLFGVFLGIGFSNPATGSFLMACLCVGCIIAFICLISLFVSRRRYTCPECGTRRIHGREVIDTEIRNHTGMDRDHGRYSQTYIKYKCHDTYICPNCGNTLERDLTVDGGSYTEYADRHFRDGRKDPMKYL